MIAFQPKGPIKSFTAATSAPTSVQAISLSSEPSQQYKITNTDTSNDVTVGWGASDAEAKLNAAAGATVANCTWIEHASVEVITAPVGAYFSGITGSSTAVVKVQNGIGN